MVALVPNGRQSPGTLSVKSFGRGAWITGLRNEGNFQTMIGSSSQSTSIGGYRDTILLSDEDCLFSRAGPLECCNNLLLTSSPLGSPSPPDTERDTSAFGAGVPWALRPWCPATRWINHTKYMQHISIDFHCKSNYCNKIWPPCNHI